MRKKADTELDRLKEEFVQAERLYSEQKECLAGVINTFGTVVDMHPEFSKEAQCIKKLVKTNKGALPLDRIQQESAELRRKIFSKEMQSVSDKNSSPKTDIPDDESLFEACRTIKKIMVPLLDDFYPISGELKARADAININCHEKLVEADFEDLSTVCTKYVGRLKNRISEDFRLVNKTMITFLEQIKSVEKVFASNFGGKARIKELEYFEMKVNSEMGTIVNSFDIHTTVTEIKGAVVNKLKNIKKLMAKNRAEEVKRSKMAQENIEKLNKRIAEVEKDAKKMSRKAERFQKAATKDGLTGVFNRKSFDVRVEEALKSLNNGGEAFCIILFDVNKFKWINDTFGHVAGDKVLKVVARTLQKSFRKNDIVARYGGDEFAILLEGMQEDEANENILRFKEHFKKQRFASNMENKDIHVTVSAGIAPAESGESIEKLIHRADMAMYAAKNKSR